ncbi:hypothetical protein DY000_02016220 [Brassica cretica]|uniref:Uncharacterized protein n=1 Tax=Brassica cretica TaxID=69181 RepID=A0ABQ7CMI7_BRACR|nr:hypothetical protein DY000_02016220 [Brassica cretica]
MHPMSYHNSKDKVILRHFPGNLVRPWIGCLVPESLEGAWVKGSRDCRFLGWRMDFTFELWIAQRLFMLLLRHRGVLLDV